ncbi:hypothetical protein GF407_05655 [candidate division KSB1 bacterium]|nr:hypothetical protein [candidate division KSB1 bacterium]
MLYFEQLNTDLETILEDYTQWAESLKFFNVDSMYPDPHWCEPILLQFLGQEKKLNVLTGHNNLYIERDFISLLHKRGAEIGISCGRQSEYSCLCFENRSRIAIALVFSYTISPHSQQKLPSGVLLDQSDSIFEPVKKDLDILWLSGMPLSPFPIYSGRFKKNWSPVSQPISQGSRPNRQRQKFLK